MSSAYLPAEWEPHDAIWTAWPADGELWQEDLRAAQTEFRDLCAAIQSADFKSLAPAERLNILIRNSDEENQAADFLAPKVDLTGVDFKEISYGDIWLRDTGPLFVGVAGQLEAIRFKFNGWGGKYILEHDDQVATRILESEKITHQSVPFVFEGGALETDGAGLCLTTKQCLLNANRNPEISQSQQEQILSDCLGFKKFLWLERGLHLDHTDGHIDNLARFIAPGRVLCMRACGADDPQADVLSEIEERLRTWSDVAGRPLQVETLQSPGKILDGDGDMIPASYMNFLISNRAVVVPIYGSKNDQAAVVTIQKYFPGRVAIGARSNAILSGGGSFHCITQQQPSLAALKRNPS